MMEKRGEIFSSYSTSTAETGGATPKGQSQHAAATRNTPKTQLREGITITAPSPVFKKR